VSANLDDTLPDNPQGEPPPDIPALDLHRRRHTSGSVPYAPSGHPSGDGSLCGTGLVRAVGIVL
jgi:hypothetical protein